MSNTNLTTEARNELKEIGYSQCISDFGDLIREKYPKGIPDEIFHFWLGLNQKKTERYEQTVLQS